MITRQELNTYLDTFLNAENMHDYAPNGLQVEGKSEIQCIVTGVSACQVLLDAAVEHNADAIIVHHGYFWRAEKPQLTQIKQRRLKTLLTHDINLFAYHLPLDVHAEVGNNVQLAKLMQWKIVSELASGTTPNIGLIGELAEALPVAAFAQHLQQQLGREPLTVLGGEQTIKTLAWCTGAAQDFIEHAAQAGVDAYVSGEISERTFHAAKELGIHYFAAGHHATERGGVQALGQHLSDKFDVDVQFIDIDNPV